MTTTSSAIEGKSKATITASSHAADERRRRRRAKISAQVHVQGSGDEGKFTEVCSSIDVSRDGLLFTASRAGYWKGQQLSVMFPYSAGPSALNTAQIADIVRVSELAGGKFAVAVQFRVASAAAGDSAKSSASTSASPGSAHSASLAVSSGPAKKQSIVLAVEPDARTAEVLRNMCQQDGYTVVIVPTAQEALDVLRTTVPSVFIAEVEASDMSGQDLCLIIKRNERLQRVPVILLTRSAQPADYSASHKLGAVVCMAKPFQPERLLHVIRLVAPPPNSAVKTVYSTSRSSGAPVERNIL